jgi:uncharacterized membrane protein
MPFCNMCGTQIAEGASVCAACSTRRAATATSNLGLPESVAGMLAYVTIIPAIIFLLIEPYSRNRFVRFHSFQSLFFAAALFVLHFGFRMFWLLPFMGFITLPLRLLVDLGAFVIWIILLIKASQGLMYKLPVIGDLAEKQANVF